MNNSNNNNNTKQTPEVATDSTTCMEEKTACVEIQLKVAERLEASKFFQFLQNRGLISDWPKSTTGKIPEFFLTFLFFPQVEHSR